MMRSYDKSYGKGCGGCLYEEGKTCSGCIILHKEHVRAIQIYVLITICTATLLVCGYVWTIWTIEWLT